ncbi:hypothetical protein VSH64_30585 [Amycolatopsis rhabdoformis]|uniref:Uncharacterized protein n=1 Tax=Amycolatopsis rhabdoformis TaxID=1448059 RepID=A0ABZ1HYC5_9PSEU|nr:hypothetical protein [Amycolatopsis rhabdoformis]WSE27202.1 hypothetical protein VSH64_30585 [Amycolatopsis rhabdoformis]
MTLLPPRAAGKQPNLDEIEAHFVALLDGRMTRDAVDRWARHWRTDASLSWDPLSLWALDLLFGIDLRPGPGEPYLHDDSQVQDWLVELRTRRASFVDFEH